MNRSQRVRLVVAVGVGLFALFVAFIGAPLVAALLLRFPGAADDSAGFLEVMSSSQRIANAAGLVSLASLVFAGLCLLYVLVLLAGWFIGPREESRDHPG